MPILKPVGHHSTKLNDAFALSAATAALQSRGTTSPRYSRATAMYFPLRGSQTTIWLFGSKPAEEQTIVSIFGREIKFYTTPRGVLAANSHWKVRSWTLKLSWALLAAEMTGA